MNKPIFQTIGSLQQVKERPVVNRWALSRLFLFYASRGDFSRANVLGPSQVLEFYDLANGIRKYENLALFRVQIAMQHGKDYNEDVSYVYKKTSGQDRHFLLDPAYSFSALAKGSRCGFGIHSKDIQRNHLDRWDALRYGDEGKATPSRVDQFYCSDLTGAGPDSMSVHAPVFCLKHPEGERLYNPLTGKWDTYRTLRSCKQPEWLTSWTATAFEAMSFKIDPAMLLYRVNAWFSHLAKTYSGIHVRMLNTRWYSAKPLNDAVHQQWLALNNFQFSADLPNRPPEYPTAHMYLNAYPLDQGIVTQRWQAEPDYSTMQSRMGCVNPSLSYGDRGDWFRLAHDLLA